MNIWITVGLIILVALIFGFPLVGRASIEEARKWYADGAVLVDVRTPEEFRAGSADGAINLPLGDLLQLVEAQGWSKDTRLLLFCRSGNRSGIAKRQLHGAGFEHILNVGTVNRAHQVLR